MTRPTGRGSMPGGTSPPMHTNWPEETPACASRSRDRLVAVVVGRVRRRRVRQEADLRLRQLDDSRPEFLAESLPAQDRCPKVGRPVDVSTEHKDAGVV